MKLSENIDKVIWTILDKGLFVVYGFVSLLQIRRLDPSDLGIYAILISMHTWIFVISDSLFLQNIIQFGFRKESEHRTNTYSFVFLTLFVVVISFTIFLGKHFLISFFAEPKILYVANTLPILTILTIPRAYGVKFIYKHSRMFHLFLVNLAFFGTMSIHTIYLFFALKQFYFSTMVEIYLLGTIISSIVTILLTKKLVKVGFSGSLTLKEYFGFSLPVMGFSLFQSIPKQLDVLFLQYFFQSKIVGVYYSAKTLFRLFEEGINAGFSLVYPTAVRLISKQRQDELLSLLSKSISFTFLIICFLFIILEIGGTKLFISFFLPERYSQSIQFFNFMLWGTLFMPFQLIATLIMAQGKPKIVTNFIIVSASLVVALLLFVGVFNFINLIPLGIVVYYISFAILLYFYGRRNYGYSISQLNRGIYDIINYIKAKRFK